VRIINREVWTITAALLLLLVGASGQPRVGLADDDNDNQDKKSLDKPEINQQTIVPPGVRPDLKIEYTGFLPPTEHTITFTVTNIGTAPSTAIKARIQTLSGGPVNLATPDVPSLAPGKNHVLFYGIGTCRGQVVQATVNDPLDFPSVNDRAETEVCPILPPIVPESPPVFDPTAERSSPTAPVGPSRIGSILDSIPEHLRAGEHKDGGQYAAVEIAPTVFRRHGLRRTSEGPLGDPADECDGNAYPYTPHVGFDFDEGGFCDERFVYQLILDFDLQWLRDIQKKLIFRAELLFGEGPRNSDVGSPTCVSRVGPAPANWPEIVSRTSGTNSLTPTLLTTQNLAGDRFAGGWDVTEEIRLTQRPDLADQWHGLVLHGLDENIYSDDYKICVSHINNARLKLQYVVL
jgi:hypothetical protein